MQRLAVFAASLMLTWATAAAAIAPKVGPRRSQPASPLPHHPGNVFVHGEIVVIPLPAAVMADRWQLVDDQGQPCGTFRAQDGRIELGRLSVGYYELHGPAETNEVGISLAVLAPATAPTPAGSPIALDVATAWFYPPQRMEEVASLCTLAGINWVRDRLNWAQVEPERGRFDGLDKYDASARIQARAGLRVLQVNHVSPAWANPVTKRFPLDLRDAHRFYQEMGRRWQGEVHAFEPWNEPDIDMFGGHTGSEIASLQKAAFWGLRSGARETIRCLAVFALHNRAQLDDFHANEAWPYFDTFNLHHYARFEDYPALYADFRAVSAGRPLWVTEAALPVRWANAATKEPDPAGLRTQAERIAKTFATALHEGPELFFYFLLPHYVEGPTQFGILRPDLTPRPAYAALAAAGRLLADARPLGQLNSGEAQHGYLFQARPDGRKREVLVIWNRESRSTLTLPVHPVSVWNHLGQEQPAAADLPLTTAPMFAVLPAGSAPRLPLLPPPADPPFLDGKACPAVLAASWPAEKTALANSAYRIPAGTVFTLPAHAYHFGCKPLKGQCRITTPPGWSVRYPSLLELRPGERQECPLQISSPANASSRVETLRIEADFGRAGRAILSLRLLPDSKP